MPGFLGGSSGSSGGTGGEITFPKEFIDPVTKLRVSQPENLIDTDFEYGLQPTKWETVELINNTPSFFSKSGDTTIPNITSISTNNGTREITVVTATDHGLAVGIPINVTGTKSVTADGSYVINSVPNTLSFTYLCKDEQVGNNAIEDLYSSIITGEFFQGSQIRIADSLGITTDAEPISTLTVKTDSTHGFGLNTPFYFLNLNSTISQEFEASNTAAKSFDSSNSATAQTFDGSNTLSTFNIDWSNSATLAGTTSSISTVNTTNDTITVAHGTENFSGQPLGTPLYYNLTSPASSGYFSTAQNPRGVVFLKTTTALNNPVGFSTFQVSATPDGAAIDIVSDMSGTFQLANQARTFAGNNINPLTQTDITVIRDTSYTFDGGNQGYAGVVTNGVCTVEGYAGTILVSTTAGAGLDYYVGAMVRYATTGSAAAGLTNNATYFINSYAITGTPNQYRITLKEYPDSVSALAPTGGSGDQTFTKIGVSIDKNIVHAKNAGFAVKDMVEYSFPAGAGGRFAVASVGEEKLFYIVDKVYDSHNFELSESVFSATAATGGTTSDFQYRGSTYRQHVFATVGTTNFVVSSVGTLNTIDYLIVGGGGSGGGRHGGGGGAGGYIAGKRTITATTYPIVVGAGGVAVEGNGVLGNNGNPSSFGGETANGGGGGGVYGDSGTTSKNGAAGGSGGGAGYGVSPGASNQPAGITGTAYGFAGGSMSGDVVGAGGGGAAAIGGFAQVSGGDGGPGRIWLDGFAYAGGGGGESWNAGRGGNGGFGGGGGGNKADGGGPAIVGLGSSTLARNAGGNGSYLTNNGVVTRAGSGGANTGAGGGGAGQSGYSSYRGTSGAGGSGIVIIRYPITPTIPFVAPTATGGTTATYTDSGITYRTHSFTTVGADTFAISNLGTVNEFDILMVGGGGAAGTYAGGGGGGEVVHIQKRALAIGSYPLNVAAGGVGSTGTYTTAFNGGQTTGFSETAKGGGGAKSSDDYDNPVSANGTYTAVANGGGGSSRSAGYFGTLGTTVGTSGTTIRYGGNRGGQTLSGGGSSNQGPNYPGGGGGGAGGSVTGDTGGTTSLNFPGSGGPGVPISILSQVYYFGGGGGGGIYYNNPATTTGNGGIGGGGVGGNSSVGTPGGSALSSGGGGSTSSPFNGGNGGANTGGGGGAGRGETGGRGGNGGSGIIVVRYAIS
jgi:hypothetical protein